MGDLNYLKDNVGFVVTGASVKKSALESAKEAI